MEPIEAPGEWWLPENPDKKVPGILSVSEEGRAELRLIGAFRSWRDMGTTSVAEDGSSVTTLTQQAMENAAVYPRIVGISQASQFTLEDCFRTGMKENLLSSAPPTERIHVGQTFKGVLFEPGEALEFSSLTVQLDWLPYWLRLRGIEESVTSRRQEDDFSPVHHDLKLTRQEPKSFPGLDGGTITLGQTYGLLGDGVTERRLKQDAYFTVEAPDLSSVSSLLRQASLIQDLVSIGTGKVAAFRSVSLTHPDITTDLGGKRVTTNIDMYAPWQLKNPEEIRTLWEHDLVFSFDDIGGVAGIGGWLTGVRPYQYALSRAMATRYARGGFAADSFFATAAALEAYDRTKHQDNQYYVDRLKRCGEFAGVPFVNLVGKVDNWARVAKDARNDVAHHNPGVGDASLEQVILGRSAYWLFVICMLREAGAPESLFKKLQGHSSFRWVRDEVAQLLAVSP